MRRGRQQVLFNFLPGKTFDHESGQFICRVTRFGADQDVRLNKAYVLGRVASLLKKWPDERRRGLPNPYRFPDKYVLAVPKEVESEVFPLLFECTNPACRRVTSFTNVGLINKINPKLQCRKCGSSLIQLHHVFVHECGNIRSFRAPSCPRHGYEHMWLDTRESQKYSQFRWRCRLCAFQKPIVYPTCGDCDLPNQRMRPIVHRASPSYYAQYVTLVNLPGRDLTSVLQDQDCNWLAIAAYLRLFAHGPDDRLVDLVANTGSQAGAQGANAALERILKIVSPEARQEFETKLAELRDGPNGGGGDRRGALIKKVKELVSLRGALLEDAGRELLEYVRPIETQQITTLAQLEQRAQREMPGRLPVYQVAYRDAVRRTGLSDVRLISDFPVSTVVVGYTRCDRGAEKTILRAFPRLEQSDARVPLFVDTVETEALMFCLDASRVFRWLVANGLADRSMVEAEDETGIRAWILERMPSIDPYEEIPQSQPVARAVYGLAHSFSHLVLRQAVIQSGFDRTSLSEYLFPRALSFVVYSNNRSKFTIGGLYSLFEQTLHEHLRSVLDKGEACVYDPVCMSSTGACHACMHISEISCQHFNRNLSRMYLFGRIEADGREFVGYWDERCSP